MLEEIYHFFKEKAEKQGFMTDFYIAGGSVRDSLVGRSPVDFDVFLFRSLDAGILNFEDSNITKIEPDKSSKRIITKIKVQVPNDDSYSGFKTVTQRPFALFDYLYKGEQIQVIYQERDSIHELLNDFDWNICRFAYGKIPGTDKVGFIKKMDESEIVCHGDLKLHNPKNPLLSLERGFKFAQRYKMKIQENDLRKLAHLINIQEQNKDYSI